MTFQASFFYGRCGAVAGAIALLASCGGGGGNNGGGAFLPIVPPVVTKYVVGGTVTGLAGSLVLQNNAGDDLQVTADGKFSFATAIAAGSNYAVTVRTQPFWQFCTVTKGSGTVTATSPTSAVACSAAKPQVSTLAGSGASGALDGKGTAATFADPFGIVIDKNGGLIVSDVAGNRVRKITANGDVTTFAGDGKFETINGNGGVASFNALTAIALAPSGDLYAAEFSGNRIRRITPAADVTTFLGTNTAGSVDGNAATASFTGPIAMTVDGAGNLYLAELNTSLIRKITPAGDVETLAGSGGFGYAEGTGSAASFYRPYGIAVDAAGDIFVADSENNRIRRVKGRVVTTFAGSGAPGAADGEALSATFNRPGGLAFDTAGNLYVADTSNSILRKITPQGVVSTVAGQAGVMGSQNGIGSAATFSQPSGVAVAADGTIYVADTLGNRIRKIAPVGAP
jgi:sugar lactone lactonase YvrE